MSGLLSPRKVFPRGEPAGETIWPGILTEGLSGVRAPSHPPRAGHHWAGLGKNSGFDSGNRPITVAGQWRILTAFPETSRRRTSYRRQP